MIMYNVMHMLDSCMQIVQPFGNKLFIAGIQCHVYYEFLELTVACKIHAKQPLLLLHSCEVSFDIF